MTGKQRIAARFAALEQEGRGGFIPFITAGDPDCPTSARILDGLPAAGADLIELGVPFSDPMADGPAIQDASQRALKAGMTLEGTLEMVTDFRKRDKETPLILMGYANPIHAYGPPAFARDAAAAGVDGVITVDVPPEEATFLVDPLKNAGLCPIFLATPTTDSARLTDVLRHSDGFLYYVSIAGVTGTAHAQESVVADAVKRLKARTDLPVAVGFGIRTPEQAAAVARIADAAVVGSAIVKTAAGGDVEKTLNFVKELAKGERES